MHRRSSHCVVVQTFCKTLLQFWPLWIELATLFNLEDLKQAFWWNHSDHCGARAVPTLHMFEVIYTLALLLELSTIVHGESHLDTAHHSSTSTTMYWMPFRSVLLHGVLKVLSFLTARDCNITVQDLSTSTVPQDHAENYLLRKLFCTVPCWRRFYRWNETRTI